MGNPSLSGTTPVTTRLHRKFLRSMYISVALGCICLVYAEWTLIPEIGWFAIAVGLLIGVAYLFEEKRSLSNGWANVFGGIIAVFAGAWFAFQTIRPTGGLVKNIPWPLSMLPYVGPLLMILLPFKLFRPKKTADFWGLHVIGLVCVGLGCVLADDAVFGALLVLYLFFSLWCLALFVLDRNLLQSASTLERAARLPRWPQVASWAFPILIVALIVFMYTPRSGTTWQFSGEQRNKIEVGMPEDSSVDLNRSGSLELNRDVAFEVYAEDNWGRPKLNLDPWQRWRGPAYRYYNNGRWSNLNRTVANERNASITTTSSRPPPERGSEGSALNFKLPDLGPNQFFLTYQLHDKLHLAYLAAPIVFPTHSTAVPVIQLGRSDRPSPFYRLNDGGLAPVHSMTLLLGQSDPTFTVRGRYKQVTVPVDDTKVVSAVSLERSQDPGLSEPLVSPNLSGWTMALLQLLVAQKKLDAEALDKRDDGEQFWPRNHEVIARALERYLAASGEYKYSLELRRSDRALDPVEDFLLHTKAGSCTRFSSALAIMLRSIHIPCQVVLGFRGADSRGDGHYDVRHCHAHGWVEVLVPRRDAPPAHGLWLGRETWHWVILDPTPTDESLEAVAAANAWWNSSQWSSEQLFNDLILNYSPDGRDQAGQLLWEAVTESWAAFERRITASSSEGMQARVIVTCGLSFLTFGFGLVVRRVVRRRAKRLRHNSALFHATAFYRRMLTALAYRGWKPSEFETPREFAAAVGPRLPDSDCRALVDHVTSLYYRVRFGDLPLAPEESKQIDDGLKQMAHRLARN